MNRRRNDYRRSHHGGSRRGYDRHGYDRGRRSHGGSGWLVWIVIVAAVVMWGSANKGSDTPRQDTPRKGDTSTVCTEYFRGGC